MISLGVNNHPSKQVFVGHRCWIGGGFAYKSYNMYLYGGTLYGFFCKPVVVCSEYNNQYVFNLAYLDRVYRIHIYQSWGYRAATKDSFVSRYGNPVSTKPVVSLVI